MNEFPFADSNFDRFISKVHFDGPKESWMDSNCWIFVPPRSKRVLQFRRPTFNLVINNKHIILAVSHISWYFSTGKLDLDSHNVISRCKNLSCIRPSHLYIGQKYDNHAQEYIAADGLKYKACSICKVVYPFTKEFFSPKKYRSDKFSARCIYCNRLVSNRYKKENWAKILLYRMCKTDSTCSITEEQLLELYDQQGGRCYWLGVPLEPSNIHRYPAKISPDRLARNEGYILDNLVLTSVFANIGRNSCDLVVFIDYLQAHLEIFGQGVWTNDSKWRKYYVRES